MIVEKSTKMFQNCAFCAKKKKIDLRNFWNGQKQIELLLSSFTPYLRSEGGKMLNVFNDQLQWKCFFVCLEDTSDMSEFKLRIQHLSRMYFVVCKGN